ncbi:hypothetical protein STAFG_8354 [Streptomyces afghaniensis 772]|uniref:Uncharacterized protein n=1 Tax=Streptomyces afghaniensis 772 TaxID=1283301 RepID=S4N9W0_9ACTN|nr:hypothetical protein STAFG_8354 [Streptomyces afghaniensis 772]
MHVHLARRPHGTVSPSEVVGPSRGSRAGPAASERSRYATARCGPARFCPYVLCGFGPADAGAAAARQPGEGRRRPPARPRRVAGERPAPSYGRPRPGRTPRPHGADAAHEAPPRSPPPAVRRPWRRWVQDAPAPRTAHAGGRTARASRAELRTAEQEAGAADARWPGRARQAWGYGIVWAQVLRALAPFGHSGSHG